MGRALLLVFGALVALAQVESPAGAVPRRKRPAPVAPAVPRTPIPEGVDSELIKQALAAYDEPDYDRAIELLQKAQAENLTRAERIVTFRTLAFCHAALSDARAARADFENMLRLDRDAELDQTAAPRVRALFEEAKKSVAPAGSAAPTVRLLSVEPSLQPARPVEARPLIVRVDSPTGAADTLIVFHRVRGSDAYSRVEARAGLGGRFVATIPAMAVRAPGVEYYVDLTDERGVTLARGGTQGAPLAVDVSAPRKPLYAKAWFWGVMGGALVAVGAGVAVAVILTRPTIAAGTPASVTFQPY